MLKRKIYKQLVEWKNSSNGSTSLLIKGERAVGKSFIVREFAQNEYKSHIIIDFGNVSKDIINLFNYESDNLDLFFSKLSVFFSTTLYKRESVIIFDEVQQFPRARQLIKYLVEDKRYDYIETSSLLTLKENSENIIIPSEEEHIEMFPLDFEEFLWAKNDEVTLPFLKNCFDNKKEVGKAIHTKVMNDFKQYMLVGGMPQSILAYIKECDFNESDKTKRSILQTLKDDITIFTPRYKDKVCRVFDNIPEQLSKKEKKYTLSSLGTNARFRNYEDSFIYLDKSMIVNNCYNCTDPNIPLALSSDPATRKCYMADTGLLVTQTFWNKDITENKLYKAILFDKLDINEGMIMENIVAQILRTNGHQLYYYSKTDNLHRCNHIKIDFLLIDGNKLSPIEVKACNYRSHSSIDKFIKKFSSKVGTPYILYPGDVMKKDNIWHLPLYMAIFL